MRTRFVFASAAVGMLLTALSMRATPVSVAAQRDAGDDAGYIVLQMPGFAMTIPNGVNERGEVVGRAFKCTPDPLSGFPSYEDQGFRYWKGRYSLIEAPDATHVDPTAINSRGEAVGYLYTATNQLAAFVHYRGQLQFVAVPGVTDLVPQGINSRGDIVGWRPAYGDHGVFLGYQAFLLRRDQLLWLTPPGSTSTQAWGINSSGVIVGSGLTPPSTITSFVYERGEYLASPVPGSLYGINDRGDLLTEQPGLIPRTNVYRNGARLDLPIPESDYTISGISNTRAVGVIPPVQNANGCSEGTGFMVGLPSD